MFPIRDTIAHRHAPVMTWILIAANAAAFGYQLLLPDAALAELVHLCGIVPARFTHPEWAARMGYPEADLWPFLTSMFLHGGWLHVVANLWTLWIFGDNVEDRMGPLRFLAFYLACGLAAGAIHFLTNAASTAPTIGASGAIAGVMGAYFVLYPRARVLTVVPVFFWPLFFELPAVVYLGFWFLMQFFSGAMAVTASAQEVGGIAWWAHVGGFVAGIALLGLFLRPRPPPAREPAW
jgi:membrane associated rhomboid family serine protease